MNKYQEAMSDLIKRNEWFKKSGIHIGTQTIELLQELVDKATPKKPLMENIDYICCPNCHSDVELYDYYHNEVKLKQCNRCGQAIDWSEDE